MAKLSVPCAFDKLTILQAIPDDGLDWGMPGCRDPQGADARFRVEPTLPEVHEMIPASASPAGGILGYSRAGLKAVSQEPADSMLHAGVRLKGLQGKITLFAVERVA